MSFAWSRRLSPNIVNPYATFDSNGNLFDARTLSSKYNMVFYDESGVSINSKDLEYSEQCICSNFITPDDVVLELGARYGTVSCIINKILNNKRNQVSVEPDKTVWNALDNNIKLNGCNITLHKGFISKTLLSIKEDGYASYSIKDESSDNLCKTLEEIEESYSLKFNTLVADCEGFLETFLDENPKILKTFKKIIFEADRFDVCNYGKIRKQLLDNGFRAIIYGFQNVYVKE